LQEAIGNPTLHNGGRLVGLILGVIAKHMASTSASNTLPGAETKAPKYS